MADSGDDVLTEVQAPVSVYEKTLKTRKKIQYQLNQATTALDDAEEELQKCEELRHACQSIYDSGGNGPERLASIWTDAYNGRTSRAMQIAGGLGGMLAGGLGAVGADYAAEWAKKKWDQRAKKP